MKLQIDNKSIWRSDADMILSRAKEASQFIGLEYGIFIRAKMNCPANAMALGEYHIWFEVNGHQFETVKELRIALENKAFL